MKIAKIAGSILLLISFFMPWVDAMITSVSGFELPQAVNDLMDMAGEDDGAGILYILYLIPLLSLVFLVLTAMNKNTKIFGLVTGVVALLIQIVMMIKGGSMLTDSLQFGFYLSGISALIILVSSLATKSHTNSKNTA
jgi:hypothetical protein